MSLAVRRAAPAAALLVWMLLPAPAAALERPDVLVAQIAQAAPTATPSDEPPLTEDPPTSLDGTPTPVPSPTAAPTAVPNPLPETGSDAGLVALAGLSLLGMGLGLRLGVRDGRPAV